MTRKTPGKRRTRVFEKEDSDEETKSGSGSGDVRGKEEDGASDAATSTSTAAPDHSHTANTSCSNDTTITSAVSDLKNTILKLCDRILSLERAVDDQKHEIEKLKSIQARPIKSTTIATTQTEPQIVTPGLKSYAETAKSTKSTPASPAPSPSNKTGNKQGLTGQRNTKRTLEDKKRMSDVRKANDATNKTSLEDSKSKKNNDFPSVVILSDSILKGVQMKRLGRSYGFSSKRQKTYVTQTLSLQPVDSTNDSEVPDAIVIHCGINDLKTQDAETVSKCFIKAVKQVKVKHPSSHIVVSQATAVEDAELDAKRELFNAFVRTELLTDKSFSFVPHTNFYDYGRDGMHPTIRGSSILAANLGRHLRDLLWEKPKKPSRRLPPPPGRWGPQMLYQDVRGSWWNPYKML